MSDATKAQFMKDLKIFYTAFTGNETMPPEITKFSDIKLRDYNKKNGCQGTNPIFKNKYTLNKKDKLFADYAENTKKMIQTAADNQSKLLSVINELFTYIIDPYSGKKVIRVNPKLTDESLQKAVEKTRKLIVNLYVKCETDYVNGVKLYEAIVESKIIETTQKQIQTLKTEASKIIQETKKETVPVKETPFVKPPPVVVAGPVTGTTSSTVSLTSSTPLTQVSSITPPSANCPNTPISSQTSSTPVTTSSTSSTSVSSITTPSQLQSLSTPNNVSVSPASTIPSSIPTPPTISGVTQITNNSLPSTTNTNNTIKL
jgi:hypothetical protein